MNEVLTQGGIGRSALMLCILTFFLFFSFSSASKWDSGSIGKFDYVEPTSSGNETTITGDCPDGYAVQNITDGGIECIEMTGGTGSVSVNSTQFDSDNPIHIKTSWLTSFIESISKWGNYYDTTQIDNRYSNNTGDQDLSPYWKNDGTATATGNWDIGTNIKLNNDNSKLYFGAGDDLDAYFDGSWGRMKTSSSIPLLIGPTPTHLTLNAGGDGVGIVTNVITNTPTARGLTVWAEYNGSIGKRSNPMAGINAFAHIYGADNLSGTINGGTTAGRYVVRHYGTGTISSVNGISVLTTWGGVGKGTLTTAKGVQIEDVPVTTGRAIGDYIDLSCGKGVHVNGGSVTSRTGVDIKTSSKASGTFTNQYGVHIQELSGADNNYEILLDSAGSIFFRDSAIHIDSLNDGYLDLTADSGIRLNALVDAGANDIQTTGYIKGVHKTADGTSAVADGTYTMGLGGTSNGTITIKDGIITAIQEAVA